VIAHIVIFRPRPGRSDTDRRSLADAFRDALRDIPSIRRARIGRRVTHGRPYESLMRVDYQYAAVLEFDDQAGLRAYLEHPAHEALASRFFDTFEDALMYDFDLKDGTAGVADLVG
jgi:hypothetical protein